MNLILLAVLFATIAVLLRWSKGFQHRPKIFALENVAEGVALDGQKTFYADGAFSTRFLLVKSGSDSQHVTPAGGSDDVLGVSEDSPGSADDLTVIALLGAAKGTRRVATTAAAINFNTLLVPDATETGLARALPSSSGTYRVIGRSLNMAASDPTGDVIEFAPFDYCFVTVEESS